MLLQYDQLIERLLRQQSDSLGCPELVSYLSERSDCDVCVLAKLAWTELYHSLSQVRAGGVGSTTYLRRKTVPFPLRPLLGCAINCHPEFHAGVPGLETFEGQHA